MMIVVGCVLRCGRLWIFAWGSPAFLTKTSIEYIVYFHVCKKTQEFRIGKSFFHVGIYKNLFFVVLVPHIVQYHRFLSFAFVDRT